MTKRIAIIGSGISGLTCGHLLAPHFDIEVYESNDYIGGHTATVDVEVSGKNYAIDTGFIVFNDWTYPNFIALMDKLGVQRQPTEMSFSVKNPAQNIEYNGNTINSLFAQRRNLFRPRFFRIVCDILRFNKLCKQEFARKTAADIGDQTLGDFLQQHNFSEDFQTNYILPMCAAIWSMSLRDIRQFSLAFFLQFFTNHGLLNITNRPQWYTIVGGSREYIAPMTRDFHQRIHLNSQIERVERSGHQQQLVFASGHREGFDEVIFACHSNQALALMATPTQAQQEILAAIPYADNDVVLHTDVSLLPKRQLAWASWNYLLKQRQDDSAPASLTYNMNILQRLEAEETFCVTLNNTADIDPDKILRRFTYAHPQFSLSSLKAQQRRADICGVDNLHFCGAYWYNGFHEDGVRSAIDVCKRLGVTP